MMNKVTCNQDLIDEYAIKLKAIGHPVRLKLLCLIEQAEAPCVSNLWQCLGQPQPVVSQHLAILKRVNIVKADIEKTKRVYSISDPHIKAIIKVMVQKGYRPC